VYYTIFTEQNQKINKKNNKNKRIEKKVHKMVKKVKGEKNTLGEVTRDCTINLHKRL